MLLLQMVSLFSLLPTPVLFRQLWMRLALLLVRRL
nr:MAG TPA: hypothetical protein [Microviridae sp.]